jgi:hypothetical protein
MIPIVKYTSNEWATGDKMHLYFKEEEACPFCGQKENMKHVFSCNNETALRHRDEALTNLETRLNKINKTKGKEWHSLASHSIKELGGDTRLETPETDTSHQTPPPTPNRNRMAQLPPRPSSKENMDRTKKGTRSRNRDHLNQSNMEIRVHHMAKLEPKKNMKKRPKKEHTNEKNGTTRK